MRHNTFIIFFLYIACVGWLVAVDEIAPVTILPVSGAPVLNPPAPVYAITGADPSAALDLTAVANASYAYDSYMGQWTDFTTGFATGSEEWIDTLNSGIAIVAVTGQGQWQSSTDGGVSWNLISAFYDEASAPLLTFASVTDPTLIRFVPDANATDGTATLSFRIWDGSDGSLPGDTPSTANPDVPSLFGGSPTAFSAETRTLIVQVAEQNDPPELNGEPSNPRIIAGIPMTVANLLATTSPFADVDGPDLGIAIASYATFDTSSGTWQYFDNNTESSGWTDLTPPAPYDDGETYEDTAFMLSPATLLRFVPYGAVPPQPPDLLTVLAWDTFSGSDLNTDTINNMYDSLSSSEIAVEVLVNTPPSAPSVSGSLIVGRGGAADFSFSATDVDTGDVLSWSASVDYMSSGSVSAIEDGYSSNATYTAPALLTTQTTDTIFLTVTDLAGNSQQATIVVTIIDNTPPVISTTPITLTVRQGLSGTFVAAASDINNDDTLSWSVLYGESTIELPYTTYEGVIDLDNASGGSLAGHFTASGSVGTDYFDLIVDDGAGGTDSVQLTVNVIANDPPTLVSSIGALAVAGQPYTALVATDDTDSPLTSLNASVTMLGGNPLPSWLTFTHTHGNGTLTGTPPNDLAGSTIDITITVADEFSSVPTNIAIAVASGADVAVTAPTLVLSTPDAVVYGAIHPGSAANLDALCVDLRSLSTNEARGFWWLSTGGAFQELPAMPANPLTAGIFLASTTALSLSYAAPPQPAPFAIILPASSWSFVGIPPVLVDGTGTVETTHSWDVFRLEDANGVAITDPAIICADIGPASPSTDLTTTQPWLWNGSAYTRASTLDSVHAYWIRNRSSQNLRLVRTLNSSYPAFGSFGSVEGAVLARNSNLKSVASSADEPPPPPSSPRSTQARSVSSNNNSGGGSSSCGAGGLAGLLVVCWAMLALRRGRRS